MYVYKEGMTEKEQKDGAYWERNMLALLLAKVMQQYHSLAGCSELVCGWYYDTDNNWEGWKRVISLDDGKICFHIPDDFDIGDLPEIKPNWDGHTTEQKWNYVMKLCGVKEV